MHLMNFVWSVAFIFVVFTRNAVRSLTNGSSLVPFGTWYVHAIQGDDRLHSQISCYFGPAFEKNSKAYQTQSYEFPNGTTYNETYELEIGTETPNAVTFYELNQNGTRGNRICRTTLDYIGPHRNVYKFTTTTSCHFGPSVDYTAVCLTKDNIHLNNGDKEDLKIMCPRDTFLQLRQDNCRE